MRFASPTRRRSRCRASRSAPSTLRVPSLALDRPHDFVALGVGHERSTWIVPGPRPSGRRSSPSPWRVKVRRHLRDASATGRQRFAAAIGIEQACAAGSAYRLARSDPFPGDDRRRAPVGVLDVVFEQVVRESYSARASRRARIDAARRRRSASPGMRTCRVGSIATSPRFSTLGSTLGRRTRAAHRQLPIRRRSGVPLACDGVLTRPSAVTGQRHELPRCPSTGGGRPRPSRAPPSTGPIFTAASPRRGWTADEHGAPVSDARHDGRVACPIRSSPAAEAGQLSTLRGVPRKCDRQSARSARAPVRTSCRLLVLASVLAPTGARPRLIRRSKVPARAARAAAPYHGGTHVSQVRVLSGGGAPRCRRRSPRRTNGRCS